MGNIHLKATDLTSSSCGSPPGYVVQFRPDGSGPWEEQEVEPTEQSHLLSELR